jgi:hypothetical protein
MSEEEIRELEIAVAKKLGWTAFDAGVEEEPNFILKDPSGHWHGDHEWGATGTEDEAWRGSAPRFATDPVTTMALLQAILRIGDQVEIQCSKDGSNCRVFFYSSLGHGETFAIALCEAFLR